MALTIAAVPRTRHDRPLFLSRGGAYTTDPARALRDGQRIEVEAVDLATLARLADRAALNRRNQRITTRADLARAPLAVRLARCKAMAKTTGVDVHNQLRLARLALEGGRSVEHVSRRVAAIEARSWPDLPAG